MIHSEATDERPTGAVPASTHVMIRSDGTRLTYCHHPSAEATPAALVVLDSRPDGAERVRRLLASWKLDDIDVFYRVGEDAEPSGAANLPAALGALDAWVRHIARAHAKRLEDVVLMASGLDALLLALWAHDFAPRLRAMVLAAPAFSADPAEESPSSGRGAQWASSQDGKLFRYTVGRLVADAAAIRVPTLLLETPVARRRERTLQQKFYERLQTPLKRRTTVAGPGRELLGDPRRSAVRDEVRQFLADVFRHDAPRPSLALADRYGYTHDEYQDLSTPLPWLSRRGLYYRLLRMGIRSLALLSPGVRLAVRTGFDSGQMLDYVYENQARGWLPLRWIDRIFLDNIGWKSCRRRKELTERMLREAIGRVTAAGQPVRVVDIAAGPGRYVLEIMRERPDVEISAILRDFMPANLDDGRRLAQQFGLSAVTFELGDAFDEESLAQIEPRPNLAVACGIYQLFSDNAPLLRSLRGLARAVESGGYLVYTSLPWDPGLEMSARSLVNRMGEAAIRRRRTQEELDELVASAGFEKVAMEIDEFGMATVSLARKP